MEQQVLQYMLSLSATFVLPTALWIIASARVFSKLRTFTEENYKEKVRESLEETVVERICQLLKELFPLYGLTPPRSAPFPPIVRNLLNEAEAPDRLAALSDMYQSLVENGIQSPFFGEVVQAVIAIMGGGG